MKILFLTIFLQLTICAAAINISNNINDALVQMQQGHIQNAVEIIKRSAGTNDILAQYYLAQCYEYGIGMSENKVQAFAMYRRAAERGFPAAMKDLSRLYSEGIGVSRSSERANEWTQRYQRRNRGSEIPDLLSIYNQGLTVENSNTTVSNHDIATNPVKTGVNSTSNQPVPTPDKNLAHTIVNIPSHPVIEKKSDVDIDIPVNKETDGPIFAFIFANENYQDLSKVVNAINDGETMAEYCNKTLGLQKQTSIW